MSLLLRTSDETGADSAPHLDVVDDLRDPAATPAGSPDLDAAVLAAIERAGAPQSRAALRGVLRVRNERLGDALARLSAAGQLTRDGDLWIRVPHPIPVPAPL